MKEDTLFKPTLEEREDEFTKAVANIANERGWPLDEVHAFIDHWCETNTGARKMKFEKERDKKSFDLARRMNTWERNYKNWNNGKELRGQNGSGGPSALDELED